MVQVHFTERLIPFGGCCSVGRYVSEDLEPVEKNEAMTVETAHEVFLAKLRESLSDQALIPKSGDLMNLK